MTSKLKQISLNTAAIAALMTAFPAATFAQSLDVTCSGGGVGGDFCQDADMTEVETVVNGNEADIATNTGDIADNAQAIIDSDAAQDLVDADQDQALADAVTAQGVTDDAQDGLIADNAQAIIDSDAAQDIVDAAQDQALDDAVEAQGVTDDAQDILISENAADIFVLDGQVMTNETNIAANAAAISTNASNIAANSADILELQNGLSDLRTDMNRGLAMANAMDVFAPDQGSQFMLNVGTGFHDGEAAFGVTGSGRVGATGSTIVYFGLAGAQGTTAGKAGVAFQW